MKLFQRKEDLMGFRRSDVQKLLNEDSPFQVKETYNSIRTKVLFSGKGERCPVFAVTSSMPNDGKTINCINMAISFAMLGKRTLLIDADMRNPTIYRYFGIRYKNGLSEVLAGLQEQVDIRQSGVENLSLITSGDIPPNPAELLGLDRLDQLLRQLREEFDYIFIDLPPVEVVTDATILANKVTGFLFVVQAGKSDLGRARHSVDTIRQLGGRIVGVVLNDLNGKTRGYSKNYGTYKGGYYYRSSYDKRRKAVETSASRESGGQRNRKP